MEAVLIAGALGLLISVGLATGRLALAEAACDHAARSAARIASLQREPSAATREASDAAHNVLLDRGIKCAALNVSATVNDAAVRAEVTCEVRWSDIAIPGLPGTRQTQAIATSAIDRYREQP